MKLKDRLSVTFIAMNLVTLIVSFLILFFLIRHDELSELDEALDAQAAEEAKLALLNGNLPIRPGILPEALAVSPRYVALYDTNGRLLSANAMFEDRAPRSLHDLAANDRRFELKVNGNPLRGVVVPLGRDGQALLYAMSRRYVDQDLAYLVKVCIALALGAIVLTWGVARGVGRLLSREVDSIAEVARLVQGGDLSARVGTTPMNSMETRALAGALDSMISQLEGLMGTQRRFIAHAAHELRSPLATLRGELQLSLRRERDTEGYRAAITRALEQAELLSTLADDLLTLARAQGKERPRGERSRTSDVVGAAIDMARAAAEGRGVRLVASVAEPDRHVVGAKRDLSRALRNLIDNGVAHGPAGGKVSIDVESADDAVIVSVTDEGEGVLDSEKPHLFTPLWRGHREQSDDTMGAGLGLAIAREISRAYGGDVELAASDGGARFVMRLRPAPSTDGEPPSRRFEDAAARA